MASSEAPLDSGQASRCLGEAARGPSMLWLGTLLGAALLIWSANYTVGKIALREIPSLDLACFRTVLSGLFMCPIYLLAQRRRQPGAREWSVGDVPRLLAVGVLGLVGNQVIFVIGLNQTSVAHGAVISGMGPIFVLLGAVMMGLEGWTARKMGGMALAAGGVILLQLGHAKRGAPSLGGDVVMMVSTMMFAGFTVFGKRLASEFGTVTVNTFAFVGGGLLLLPLALRGVLHARAAHVSPAAWASVLYMSIFPSVVGYLIYSYALRYLPASRVASVSYIQPFTATLMAVLILHEQPGVGFVGGALLVLAGVWLAGRSAEKAQVERNGTARLAVQELTTTGE